MFVGRRAELARIQEVCRSGGALVVRGEAGIGKTALITAATEAHSVVRVTGVESEMSMAYTGLHALVTQLAGPIPDSVRIAVGLLAGTTTDLATCTAVLGLLEGQVVVVDDAHWLDPASLNVLLFAARRLSSGSMIFAVRDTDLDGLPELHVTGLPDEDARKLLRPSASDALLSACAGNPLALKEANADHLLLLNGTVPLTERLQAAFSSRVVRLPVAAQEALLDVAVGGQQFVPELVAAERDGLIVVDGGVRFSHPLVRSAVYWGSTPDQRRAAHARIASTSGGYWHRALAADGPDETLAKLLEHEAERVTDRGGIAAVASILRRAAILSEDAQARTRRLAGAAYAAWKSGQPEVARDLLAQTREQPTDQPTERLLASLAGMLDLYGGDQVAAFHRLVRAAQLMPPDQAADTLLTACDAAIHADMSLDWLADAIRALDCDPRFDHLARLIHGAYEGQLDVTPWQVFDDLPAFVAESLAHRWVLPMAISWLGCDPAQARQFCLQACAAMREQGMLAIYTAVLPWLVELDFRLGHLTEAQAHAEEGLQAAKDLGQYARIPDFHSLLALVAAVRGDDEACNDHAQRAITASVEINNRYAAANATWALGILALGNREHARAAELLSTLDIPGALTSHSYVARSAAYDMSAGTDYSGSLPFYRARAALAEGERLRRDRQVAGARARLRMALDWFEQLGAGRWAERVRTELAAAGGSPTARGVLTAQQTQIARLAGRGLSNKEIADRLFLSPRTVGYHLHNIFPKLGISARRQLRDYDWSR